MLTSPPTIHRVLVSLATLVAAVLVATSSATTASAKDDPAYNGGGQYSNNQSGQPPAQGTADPANPIASGEPTPECDLSTDSEVQSAGAPPYCTNFNYCFEAAPGPMPNPPDGPKPSEDSVLRAIWCHNDGTLTIDRIFWSEDAEDEGPTLLEQALEAIGQIDLTAATLQTSPNARTLVNLDTWFWLDGGQQEVTGSSALGLVAIARFRSLSVDPGDGSGAFPCDLVTSADAAQDSCTHSYRRSSIGGSTSADGRPAFSATVTAVYDLSFEIDGNPIPPIVGAPTTLDSPPAGSAIVVDEIQSRVTQLG